MKNSGVTHLVPGVVELPLWGGEWFQQTEKPLKVMGKYLSGQTGMDSIAALELLPIVIETAIWGPKRASCTAHSNCDNEWYRLLIQGAVSMK